MSTQGWSIVDKQRPKRAYLILMDSGGCDLMSVVVGDSHEVVEKSRKEKFRFCQESRAGIRIRHVILLALQAPQQENCGHSLHHELWGQFAACASN